MSGSSDKIGIKEYTVVAMFLIGIKSMDDIPAMLFNSLKNAGWIGPLISAVFAVLPIYLLLNLAKKYPGEGFISITFHLLGKYLGFFVLFFLWGFGFIYIVFDTATYTDIISTMYYMKTPPIVIYILLVGVAAYGAKKGLEQIGSVAWSVFPYLQVSLLFAITLTIMHGNADFLFPLLGSGEWILIKESAMTVSLYVDFIYLAILIPYIKSTNDFKRGTWIAFFLIVFNLTVSMISYVMFFDYNTAASLNYPYHEAIRSIRLGFIGNMETFFFPFWLVASLVKFSIYFYINTLLFGKLFRIKHFEYIIPGFATLVLFLGSIPETPIFTVFHLREVVGNIFSPVFFFLPIALWVISKFKGEKDL